MVKYDGTETEFNDNCYKENNTELKAVDYIRENILELVLKIFVL